MRNFLFIIFSFLLLHYNDFFFPLLDKETWFRGVVQKEQVVWVLYPDNCEPAKNHLESGNHIYSLILTVRFKLHCEVSAPYRSTAFAALDSEIKG